MVNELMDGISSKKEESLWFSIIEGNSYCE
jgi:hypothetical protein